MSRLRHLLLAGIALLTLTPVVAGGPAFAGGDGPNRSTLWARHGWWDIKLFEDGTCFAFANYEYGQAIRIGINGPDDYYIMLTSPGVKDLKAVEGFPIRATFDNGRTFNGKADVADGSTGLRYMEFQVGGSMLSSFMEANNMHIHARTKQSGWLLIATMNLRGTYAAMLKTAECTAANGSGNNRPSRPSKPNPFHSTSLTQ
jgi:hypothetical protein